MAREARHPPRGRRARQAPLGRPRRGVRGGVAELFAAGAPGGRGPPYPLERFSCAARALWRRSRQGQGSWDETGSLPHIVGARPVPGQPRLEGERDDIDGGWRGRGRAGLAQAETFEGLECDNRWTWVTGERRTQEAESPQVGDGVRASGGGLRGGGWRGHWRREKKAAAMSSHGGKREGARQWQCP